MTEEGRKVGTYRGAPTGFVRDFSNVEGVKGGANIQGKRREKQARGVGLQGPIGTWGAGRGRKDSDIRDGRWGITGVGAFPGGQVIQDHNRRVRIG